MANPEHVAKLKEGVEAWNAWMFNKASEIQVDLSNANFVEAKLGHVDLSNAILSGANFTLAHLAWANLAWTDLRDAKLNEADLLGANLNGADLNGADLSDVMLAVTVLGGANLSNAKGLGKCQHFGPTTVDYLTLERSGMLPLAFLGGCGLSDNLIEYLPSLLNQPVQFYSCFISYSTKDQEFSDRLYADLQNKGVRCWFAPHDIKGGEKIHEQIDEAIQIHDRLLLILSDHSINSEWVRTEISKARKRELREKNSMLFPLRLGEFQTLQDWECFDADTGKDSAREIREYFIPDFSNWKDHDSYKAAFDRLVRDLAAKDLSAQA
jgi:uncharacterized protein YjbI with pentapeptide repeats